MDAIRVCPNCQLQLQIKLNFARNADKNWKRCLFRQHNQLRRLLPPQSKNLKKRWFVLAGGLIFLGLCACLAVGCWFYGDQILERQALTCGGNLPDLGGGTVKGDYQSSQVKHPSNIPSPKMA